MNSLKISKDCALSGRGYISFIRNGVPSDSSAFSLTERAKLQISVPRSLGATHVYVEIFDESQTHFLKKYELSWSGFINDCDSYDTPIELSELGVGLYFCRITAFTCVGYVYGYKDGDTVRFSTDEGNATIQLSVSDFKYRAPKKNLGGIIYHIFVDRFCKEGKVPVRSDAVMIDDWDNGIPEYPLYPGAHLENNTFFGGNIYGIISKLDYMASLGVTDIYLSPIFKAYSNHKYDTGDYMTVDEMFGGEEAFTKLILETKKRGMGIILDGVFNHTGADSIYFNKYGKYDSVGAYQSKDSKYYSWFDFQNYPDKYTCWWDILILPRINHEIPECCEYITGKDGVVEKYASMGIAGFRLDVVDELSNNFVAKIKRALNKKNPSGILYGEVWEDASNKIAYGERKQYYLGKELDGVMNYPLRTGIIEYLSIGNTAALHYALTDIINNAPKRIRDLQMNLLSTHDTERIISLLGSGKKEGVPNSVLATLRMESDEYTLGKKRLLLAYTVLATLPGIPAIFYGDEVGLEGYKDPFNRRPFPWGREDCEILSHYRKTSEIRRKNSVYKDGEFKLIRLNGGSLIFARSKGKFHYITVINPSQKDLNLSFTRTVRELYSGKRAAQFTVSPYGYAVFKTKIINEMFIDEEEL